MTRAHTLKDAYAFFLPLILMAEMMMISHSVIHAFIARLPDPKLTLAAYNIAFSYHSMAGSPVWTALTTSIAFITDRRSVRRLLTFNMIIAGIVMAVGCAVGLTPLGDLLFGGLMGASPPVAQSARRAILILLLITPLTIFRSLAYALLMKNRYTILVAIGAFLRLVSLAGYLLALPVFLQGAMVGAAALLLCIATEALLAVIFAHRFYLALPVAAGAPPAHREIWHFSWPLMLSQASQNGVAFTTNFFLGRLANPDLALAAFGVMDGLWRVLLGPLRNLVQTAQTLVRSRQDLRTLLRFTVQIVVGFAAVAALFFFPPVRRYVLDVVMGLTPELSATIAPAMMLFFLIAVVLGFSALCRGLLLAARTTGQIARSAWVRLLVVCAAGSLALAFPAMSGAVLGAIALIGGFASELLVLGYRVLRTPGGLFDGESPPAAGAVAGDDGPNAHAAGDAVRT